MVSSRSPLVPWHRANTDNSECGGTGGGEKTGNGCLAHGTLTGGLCSGTGSRGRQRHGGWVRQAILMPHIDASSAQPQEELELELTIKGTAFLALEECGEEQAEAAQGPSGLGGLVSSEEQGQDDQERANSGHEERWSSGDEQGPPPPDSQAQRVERRAGYSYRLVHQPGTAIGNADALSRCPSKKPVEDPAPTLHLLHIDDDASCPVSSADVAVHTQKDPTLRQVKSWILRGWPAEKPEERFSPFARKQEELSTIKGCLLWGDRVLIPSTLQWRTLETLHKGHPGIVRMKALARSYVWWPSMDRDIEQWVSRCDPCQEVRPAPPQSELAKWETPSNPWSRIHIDFAGPMQGRHLLIVVDAFSKWLEVVPMASTTTDATIRALRRLFATHGLPDVLVSDNGPQLTSLAMESFLAGLGIRHVLSAPYRPAGNGQAERMVRLTKEALTKMGPGDWQERIDNFLLTQHITPHATTHKSPAELLMGRRLRSPLDRLHPQYSPEVTATASRPLRAFSNGDSIFALNFSGSPKWLKGKIASTTGPKSYIVELEDGQFTRRHIDQLRKRWGGAHEMASASAFLVFSHPFFSDSIHSVRVMEEDGSLGSSGIGTKSMPLVT
ncbi:uncharacterized protein K02A2.6-like [Pantherophis guttatus]|uniref:Gypsy retrotransposon integrase-like protein 1 n=1 Tax=Pantherophis guttatus TaxID=94885 RepID=A0ABM3ZNZ6_PANGU|nr:uncharacterized protein K02A2.6-like [Pantherophis guttatus]